ncbi:hypothetical protein SAMN03159338_1626 [Sphingomonas sp. NFR04]|uniref:hypothetical protein n=1 Tax=Sphingomonas sp. NFR04 TaxID=1566283 RepID=UPI0008DF811B|nr:hypothetical protein [Sphingomonas sp. NFR04]SFJ51508.1 hypothetical protein SAMN03159338_1626 [Sphingomonas sp. NFR04]
MIPWTLLAPLKPLATPVAAIAVVAAAWWGFSSWRENLVESADARGFARAEELYKAQVEAANKVAEHDTNQMDRMALVLGALTQNRTQELRVNLAPAQERMKNEVAADPRYRECVVTDGMLANINAQRAAVDAAVAASNPKPVGR